MGSDYVTDIGYLRSFHADLAPARLRLVAALNGLTPPPAERFDYCELGCAYGDTTVTLAAANPAARFVGIDLNPEHVALGQRTAEDGGVGNVRFLERDFGALAAGDLGELDFIAAHGVMSWIGPEKRRALAALAGARLKPGGLLYVSYNAMPGWAAVEPLRQLILSGAGTEGDSLERARKGVAFAKQMRDAGAEYFTENPPAREMLESMEKVGLRYVVHEYLHAHWAPMYFANVAWDMAAADLHFVGSLPLHSNYRDLTIPAPLAAVFEGVSDRVTFESLKDFALNAYFRRDVYVKGKPVRSAAATATYLDATSFVTTQGALPVDRDVATAHHVLRCTGAIFDALLAALAEGSATGAHLARRPELTGFGAEQVRAALLRLLLADHVAPVHGVTLAVATTADEPHTVPSAFNRMILQRRLSSEIPIVLASAVAGTGVPLTALEAVAIRLVTEVPPAERRAWVHAHFGREELRMTIRDRAIESEEEQSAVVFEGLARFERERLAKLVELGLLEPSA
ncbi:methyltransferase regulatory domain-containing protein [soil metagenome]